MEKIVQKKRKKTRAKKLYAIQKTIRETKARARHKKLGKKSKKSK